MSSASRRILIIRSLQTLLTYKLIWRMNGEDSLPKNHDFDLIELEFFYLLPTQPSVSFSSHPSSTISPPSPLRVPLSLFLKHPNVALISIKKAGVAVKVFFLSNEFPR
jgi:hypothetical protein